MNEWVDEQWNKIWMNMTALLLFHPYNKLKNYEFWQNLE